MISVDIDKTSIEPNGTLKQCNELADGLGSNVLNRDRDRLTAVVVQSVACTKEEALQKVARGEAIFDLDGVTFTVLQDFDKCGEEVVHAFTKLLYVCVLVC